MKECNGQVNVIFPIFYLWNRFSNEWLLASCCPKNYFSKEIILTVVLVFAAVLIETHVSIRH